MTAANEIARAAARLRRAGIEEARREARLLAGAALGLDPAALVAHADMAVPASARRRLARFVRERERRRPISRILGRREFWGLSFAIGPDTLDPRPDSETLVEAVLEGVPDRAAQLRLLDLGTGSGCLLLALLSELPAARGLGIDRAPGAVATAALNARWLGLAGRADFRVGDWAEERRGSYDWVLCNPPYVPSAELAGLAPEVALHEPRLALDGGADGLAAYRLLAAPIARLVAGGGKAALEVGHGQADGVAAIFAAAGLGVAGRRADLAGIERCLILTPL